MKKKMIEQLQDNLALLLELRKSFGCTELDSWWKQSIKDTRKLLKEAAA